MGTDKKHNPTKNKVMHTWTTSYKVGAHNLQMIKDKYLSVSTWAQNKNVLQNTNMDLGEFSDRFPTQLGKYQHLNLQ